ncbi:hypothetical protein ABN250_17400 [Providencia stuartii]|uniref:hypothetical protein n=1 Tax=Providencia sp. PROV157 TaxID=2949867 RepID=UPI00234A39E8|nr:hypothetical protein [Providencia sp. PROV157]
MALPCSRLDVLNSALSQCDNTAERLTRWLTYQLPRVKQAHPGCPIHQWLNSIGAQVSVEKWQSPECQRAMAKPVLATFT